MDLLGDTRPVRSLVDVEIFRESCIGLFLEPYCVGKKKSSLTQRWSSYDLLDSLRISEEGVSPGQDVRQDR